MENEREVNNKQKATFYFNEKLGCHIVKEPKGNGFLNGYFKSDLIDEQYYWFEEFDIPNKRTRLFLCDIFLIEDYEVKQ